MEVMVGKSTSRHAWQRIKERFNNSWSPPIKEVAGYTTPVMAVFGSTMMLDGRNAGNELFNHAPSALPSYTIGIGGSLALAALSDKLQYHGYNRLASSVEKSRRLLTALGSMAFQLAAEAGHLGTGTGDVKDLAIGTLATLPGIWTAEMVRLSVITEDVVYEARQALISNHNSTT